jgi:hypothetical protein
VSGLPAGVGHATLVKRVWDRLEAAEFAAGRGPKGMARGTGGHGEVVVPCSAGRKQRVIGLSLRYG